MQKIRIAMQLKKKTLNKNNTTPPESQALSALKASNDRATPPAVPTYQTSHRGQELYLSHTAGAPVWTLATDMLAHRLASQLDLRTPLP